MMIKIERADCPTELTDVLASQLTDEYQSYRAALVAHKEDPDSCAKPAKEPQVWKKPFIEEALIRCSHGKCCFCETPLGEEGKDMQIEHFYPKSLYPEDVVSWVNLLPSCARCNREKSSHDTKSKPIINPADDIPSEHLLMRGCRLYKRTAIGKETIRILDLNDKDGLQLPRYRLVAEVHRQLEDVLRDARPYDDDTARNTRRANRITKRTKEIMREASREAEFSAVIATAIHVSDEFEELKEIFEKHELWDDELKDLHDVVLGSSLAP